MSGVLQTDRATDDHFHTIPDMFVDPESSFPEESRDPAHHFLPVSEHWLKRTFNTWRDSGVLPALEGLASDPDLEGNAVRGVASSVMDAWEWAESAINHLWSHGNNRSAQEMVAEVSPVADWHKSPVRAMDFHPKLPYLALARQDDAVEIRHFSEMEQSITLREKDQSLVSCLQWAPHLNTMLAVGAKVGVLLWYVELGESPSRFVTSWVRVETSPGHVPVATISWSPCSNYLVSGSPADTNLVVWEVPMGVASRVGRREGGGVSLVRVAPRGGRVFAASVGGVMRIWEMESWTCEKWTTPGWGSGRCQAACWSPEGDFLVFSLSGDHALYYLCYRGNNTGSLSAVVCYDLSPYSLSPGQEVGGALQSMEWDPTGQRLALVFSGCEGDSTSHGSVVVLKTSTSSVLELLPGGEVKGEGGDVPQVISFQRNNTQAAQLATVWQSGHVSFTPLLLTQLPTHTITTHTQHSQLYSTYNDETQY